MLSKLKLYLIAFGAAFLAALGLYGAGRKAGKDAVMAKTAQKSAKTAREANEKRDEIRLASGSDIDRRLSKFKRKK